MLKGERIIDVEDSPEGGEQPIESKRQLRAGPDDRTLAPEELALGQVPAAEVTPSARPVPVSTGRKLGWGPLEVAAAKEAAEILERQRLQIQPQLPAPVQVQAAQRSRLGPVLRGVVALGALVGFGGAGYMLLRDGHEQPSTPLVPQIVTAPDAGSADGGLTSAEAMEEIVDAKSLIDALHRHGILLDNKARVFFSKGYNAKGTQRHARLFSFKEGLKKDAPIHREWRAPNVYSGSDTKKSVIAVWFKNAEDRTLENIRFVGQNGKDLTAEQMKKFGVIVAFPPEAEANKIAYISVGCGDGSQREGLSIKFNNKAIPFPETIETNPLICK